MAWFLLLLNRVAAGSAVDRDITNSSCGLAAVKPVTQVESFAPRSRDGVDVANGADVVGRRSAAGPKGGS